MPVGSPQTLPNPPPVGATVRPMVEAIQATQKLDVLTRQVQGLKAYKTPAFTGATDATLVQCSPNTRLRIKKLFLMLTAQAAINAATNGSEVNVTIYADNNDTALTWTIFVAQNSVVGGNGGLLLPLDLGEDGWVSGWASLISVHADQTLSSGHFRVLALANEIRAN